MPSLSALRPEINHRGRQGDAKDTKSVTFDTASYKLSFWDDLMKNK